MFYNLIRYAALILTKLLFGIKWYNRGNIPNKGPVIIASNHVSYLDPVVLGAISFRKLSFMAKSELFDNKAFAELISSLGAFSLGRTGNENIGSIKKALRKLKQGKALIIFPEGSRSPTGQPQKPLSGMAVLAYKVNCPITPVYIKGTDKALPLRAKFIRPFRRIRVYFGKPIYPVNEPSKESYKVLSNRVMDEIKRLSNKVNQSTCK